MKRCVVLCGVLALLFCAGAARAATPQQMSVQVRNGQVRANPSFLGPIVAPVEYGDSVRVSGEQAGWMKITTSAGKEGWIHGSALTTKRVVLQAGTKDVQAAASGDELALAGKGFSSEVEAEFKAANKDIDFKWVDRMETFKVDMPEIQRFLKEGNVIAREGGQP